MLAQDGGKAADLGAESGTDVLRSVGDQVLNRGDDIVEQNSAVDERAESGNLASNGGPDFGLGVLEQPREGGDQVSRDGLLVNSLGNLVTESV